MALIDRLVGIEDPKIGVHQLYSALTEWAAGETDRATIISHFQISAADESDLDWLQGKYAASANKREFVERLHGILMLAENQYPGYQTQAEIVGIINRVG